MYIVTVASHHLVQI